MSQEVEESDSIYTVMSPCYCSSKAKFEYHRFIVDS